MVPAYGLRGSTVLALRYDRQWNGIQAKNLNEAQLIEEVIVERTSQRNSE
jgi:hypothetical protein